MRKWEKKKNQLLTSSGRFFIMIHLSISSFASLFSFKNLAEKCLACSRIFSPGKSTCVALYRLYIPVTACVHWPAKQKNSPFLSKCLNTSIKKCKNQNSLLNCTISISKIKMCLISDTDTILLYNFILFIYLLKLLSQSTYRC